MPARVTLTPTGHRKCWCRGQASEARCGFRASVSQELEVFWPRDSKCKTHLPAPLGITWVSLRAAGTVPSPVIPEHCCLEKGVEQAKSWALAWGPHLLGAQAPPASLGWPACQVAHTQPLERPSWVGGVVGV